jgi:hypothetical protein
MIDGKTYYYLYSIDEKIIHTCSGGKTLCGLSTKDMEEYNPPEGAKSSLYKWCDDCQNYKEPKKKKATFETKAEIVENPQKEEKDDLE